MTQNRSASLSTRLAIAGAAALAGTALWNASATFLAERNHPPGGKFLEVDGVRLHYHEEGYGTPVILLHGNGAMASDFLGSGLFDALAAKHRVIAFDRPGFGYSDRPRGRDWSASGQARLLVRAFKQLGVADPLIVAHSWGTICALAMATEYEEKLAGLVLISGYYYPTLRVDSILMSGPAIPLLGDAMRYTVSPLLGKAAMGKVLDKLFSPSAVADSFRTAVPESLILRPGQMRASAAEGLLMMSDAEKLSARYTELQLPITLIAGREDQIVDAQEQTVRLHEALPHSELQLLVGQGHMLHYAATDRIVDAVESTLGETFEAMPFDGNADLREDPALTPGALTGLGLRESTDGSPDVSSTPPIHS